MIYACREYACCATDVLARRTRLAFLNVHAAEEALPRVIEIMARELGWTAQKQKACISSMQCSAPVSLSLCPSLCMMLYWLLGLFSAAVYKLDGKYSETVQLPAKAKLWGFVANTWQHLPHLLLEV